MRPRLVVCFFLLSSILLSSPCFAHKVRIFAWGEGETIHTESKFSGGRPAQNANVTIINTSTGDELLQGTTDQQGLFQFEKPDAAVAEVDIVVNSGDGHKNHWLYQLSQASDSAKKTIHNSTSSLSAAIVGPATAAITEERLTQIINNALEIKLAPIRRQLAEESEQKPDFKDILGGIGYILGLAGIVAYMKSKKQYGEG